MNVHEIKQAVLAGKTVHWKNDDYVVVNSNNKGWFIQCAKTRYYIGLTWSDSETLNGRAEDFYVAMTLEERMQVLLREAADLMLETADSVREIPETLYLRLKVMIGRCNATADGNPRVISQHRGDDES